VAMVREMNEPFHLASALLRHAEALIRSGDSDGAAPAVREAHELARGMGAAPLLAEIETLARRARVRMPDASSSEDRREPPDELTRLGLTARETEVLRLVAEGLSNSQIAGKLFISPKTASVHVSNILSKLGVATRVEAAALAYRRGLVQAPADA
jgi:DNA-binding NarL/FixJ family response regulator